MAKTQADTPSTSLKIAVMAVDAVWYLSWAVTVIALVATAAVLTFPGVRDALVRRGVIIEGSTFSLPMQVRYEAAEHPSPEDQSRRSLRLIGHDDVVMARPFARSDLASFVAYRLVTVALFLWVLYQLRALMHAVKRGHPFDPANPKRIRRIAYLVIASGPVMDILKLIEIGSSFMPVVTAVRRALPGATVGYQVHLYSWHLVVLGLIILAIAHAFDAGVRLQDDQDLTV